MEPQRNHRIIEQIPPASRGSLILSDVLLGISETAAVVLRSMVGYDEGVKIESEFLLRDPGDESRPLRGALDPQNADPTISFGLERPGDLQPLVWNLAGDLNIHTLSVDEVHSRITLKTWLTPVPAELVVGVQWRSQKLALAHLRVDCRHEAGSWSTPLWPIEKGDA
jgi:hypothetical protein